MSQLRLVIFDLDGTLVDSQEEICSLAAGAFEATGRQAPAREEVLARVGLSLPVFLAGLCPGVSAAGTQELVEAYRDLNTKRRAAGDVPPLFDGARDALETLRADPWTLLAIATGKSRRGLDHTLAGHGIAEMFMNTQTADSHPSKPHPAMVEAVLSGLGVDAERAVMVGDTSFDMDMGRAAGCKTLGVSWGYHASEQLTGADAVAKGFGEVPGLIDDLLGQSA